MPGPEVYLKNRAWGPKEQASLNRVNVCPWLSPSKKSWEATLGWKRSFLSSLKRHCGHWLKTWLKSQIAWHFPNDLHTLSLHNNPESWFFHLAALWPWSKYLTSLGFTFLICVAGVITVAPPTELLWKLSVYESLGKCQAYKCYVSAGCKFFF